MLGLALFVRVSIPWLIKSSRFMALTSSFQLRRSVALIQARSKSCQQRCSRGVVLLLVVSCVLKCRGERVLLLLLNDHLLQDRGLSNLVRILLSVKLHQRRGIDPLHRRHVGLLIGISGIGLRFERLYI